jgi:hypothetical protein
MYARETALRGVLRLHELATDAECELGVTQEALRRMEARATAAEAALEWLRVLPGRGLFLDEVGGSYLTTLGIGINQQAQDFYSRLALACDQPALAALGVSAEDVVE